MAKRKLKGKQEIKAGIDLVKYLMKNEVDANLKFQLARLGNTLNKLLIYDRSHRITESNDTGVPANRRKVHNVRGNSKIQLSQGKQQGI